MESKPSKEALEAARDLFKQRYCFASDNVAAIIDRHFEPLRQRAEQNAEQCVKLNRELGLKKETTEWLNGTTIQRARAERAEARVKELEATAKCDPIVYGKLKIAEQENELAALRAANAELVGALRGLLKNAERDGDTRLAVQKALSVLARHAVGEQAVALESPHA